MEPTLTRQRFEPRRRHLTVAETRHLTPHMIRVTLTGEDLADFVSLGADDHVKLFFGDQMRDYTPRSFDAAARRLVLDFAVHEAGPATDWALKAKVGDGLTMGGPRGSLQVAGFDWYLLIGDETALPAIGRRAEEVSPSPVITLAAALGPKEAQVFASDNLQALWVHRPASAASDPAPLLAALRGVKLPPGRGFVWIAAEASVARALRDEVTGPMGHPKAWVKASGYWVKGQADAHVKLED